MTHDRDFALTTLLRVYARRVRWQTLCSRCIDAAVLLAVGLTAAGLIDAWLEFPAVARELLFDLLLFTAAARLLPAVARLMHRKTSWVRIAEHLEQRSPKLQQTFSTLMSCPNGSSPLVGIVRRSLEQMLKGDAQIIQRSAPWRPVFRRLAVGGLILVMSGVVARGAHLDFSRFLPPWPPNNESSS